MAELEATEVKGESQTDEQKDNSTFNRKVRLRKRALQELDANPTVMETHGGTGQLYKECYSRCTEGIVLEKDEQKVSVLAAQRPTWAVYECDNEYAIKHGLGAHLPEPIELLDMDPYGQPWPVIDAFFSSDRPFADKMVLTVTDGLRQTLAIKKGWSVDALSDMVEKYGNDTLYENYLDVAQELLSRHVAQAGYELTHFGGYHCGTGQQMTHYLAVLQQTEDEPETEQETEDE